MAYKKMNPKIKAKWLKALRSGRYRQGHGALCIPGRQGPRYCCLGVLARCLGVKQRRLHKGMLWELYEFQSPLNRRTEHKLSQLNDGTYAPGWSFDQIATWIEKYL